MYESDRWGGIYSRIGQCSHDHGHSWSGERNERGCQPIGEREEQVDNGQAGVALTLEGIIFLGNAIQYGFLQIERTY